MPLTSLDAVKRKLNRMLEDTSQDDAILASLESAEEAVLHLTRLSISPQTVTDRFKGYMTGRRVQLSQRPIQAIVSAQGRVLGDNIPTPLAVDVTDADMGEIVMTGSDLAWNNWIPRLPPSDYFKWRQGFVWPWVIVTYQTGTVAIPHRLADATAALAAYMFQRDRAGAVRSMSGGGVNQQFDSADIPSWLMNRIYAFVPPDGSGWSA